METITKPQPETANLKPETKANPPLRITVARGSIADVVAPVVVVGSYKGIAPAGALRSLDNEVGNWISRAIDHSMVGAELGQVFFLPVTGKQIRANSILLAGMGEYGRFSYHGLRYLTMNIGMALSGLKVRNFATVLIGSGEGNLNVEDAAKGLLSGLCDAIHRVDPADRITEFTLVEFRPERHAEILKILTQLQTKIENVDITIAESVVRHRKGKKPEPTGTTTRQPTVATFVNRITIEGTDDRYSFSALTNTAVIPVREVNVRKFFTEGIATELRDGDGEEAHEKFGRLLHNYIFPQDFERMIDDGNPLTVVVDKDTAGLPWEMACFGPKGRRTYFGRDLRLTRQFRTSLSSAPGIAPPINKSLRALVIADPAAGDLHLEGAEKEGEAVNAILEEYQKARRIRYRLKSKHALGPGNVNRWRSWR